MPFYHPIKTSCRNPDIPDGKRERFLLKIVGGIALSASGNRWMPLLFPDALCLRRRLRFCEWRGLLKEDKSSFCNLERNILRYPEGLEYLR